MCNPLNHITLGSSLLAQSSYYFNLILKCTIHAPNFFSVYGANLRQDYGRKLLNKLIDRSSSSAFMPISPFNAF